MSRIYNFSPGPSVLPESVLQQAAKELVEYGSSGQSVMEMSHRSPEYEAIIASCRDLIRQTLQVPDNYDILFTHGGATMQFAMVPLNLLPEDGVADYLISGAFAEKAWEEAARLGNAVAIASSKDDNFTTIPDFNPTMLSKNVSYLHICQNNTIYGTRFPQLPETGSVPLVADLSSCILSEPVDVSKYGVIYAGAQKNMGPAGVCVVIIRKDLVGHARKNTPALLDYKTYADNDSMYNTPATYPIYMMKLVLEWIRDTVGGLGNMKKAGAEKASLIYDYIDQSALFKGVAEKPYRSHMNLTFITGDPQLDGKFCTEAKAAGLYNLKGHRSVGGMRASIYNAMPLKGVQSLVDFMAQFEKDNK